MDGLNIGEGGKHHLNFRGLEDLGIMLHVAVIYFNIGLSKKAKNLCHQMALAFTQFMMPVFNIVGQRHFLRQPMYTLLS